MRTNPVGHAVYAAFLAIFALLFLMPPAPARAAGVSADAQPLLMDSRNPFSDSAQTSGQSSPGQYGRDCRPMTANPFIDTCGNVVDIKPDAQLLDAQREVTDQYRISPGDCLVAEFVGDLFYASVYCVANSGNLYQRDTGKNAAPGGDSAYFSFIGEVPARGLTIEELRTKLTARASSIFKNKFSITVTMTEIRPFSVSVLGGVRRPGTYKVDGATRISAAIAAAGGIVENASVRTIRVDHAGGTPSTVDLYKFFLNEDPSQNVYLQAGDTIFVGRTNRQIILSGRFHSPGKYELLPGETASDLIRFAQGPAEDADTNAVTATFRNSASDYNVSTVKLDDAKALDPTTLAEINLSSAKKIDGYIYTVFGENDIFPLYTSSPVTIGQLLSGRIPAERYSNIDLSNVVVTRSISAAPSHESGDAEGTHTYDLTTDPALYDTVKIMPGDTVYLTYISNAVFVTGAVKTPMEISYKSGMTVNDYIYLAGGPNANAKLSSVRVQRKRSAGGAKSEFYINAKDPASNSFMLLPGDIVYVPIKGTQPVTGMMNQIITYLGWLRFISN